MNANASKHTPGPWKVRDGVDECFIDAPGQVVCLAVINKCMNAPERAHETAADAKLIAAAPDLLKALAGLLCACRDACQRGEIKPDSTDIHLAAVEAQVALRRATEG